MKTKTTLILGLGNEILTDDRIGLRLVNDLSKLSEFCETEFLTAASGGIEIMELIKDHDKVIIIDSIHTSSGKPGDVYHLKPADFTETSNLSSIHDVSFLTALDLAKFLEYNLTDEIHIIAVEIYEGMEFNEQFSPQIEDRYPEIFIRVTDLVYSILGM